MKKLLHAPAFGARAGHDGRRRIHEDHHEEEQHDRGRVVAIAGEEEASRTDEPPARVAVHRRADGQHAVQGRGPAERSGSSDGGPVEPSAHEGESAHEEPEHADGVDHEVHRERVGRVLGANETRLDEREARLHEHDEEARDQGPYEVDRVDPVGRRLRDRVDGHREVFRRGLVGIGLRITRHGVGRRRRLERPGLVRNRIVRQRTGGNEETQNQGAEGDEAEPTPLRSNEIQHACTSLLIY